MLLLLLLLFDVLSSVSVSLSDLCSTNPTMHSYVSGHLSKILFQYDTKNSIRGDGAAGGTHFDVKVEKVNCKFVVVIVVVL